MDIEMDRPNLSDAFKGTGAARGAGLAGLLPPQRSSKPEAAHTPSSNESTQKKPEPDDTESTTRPGGSEQTRKQSHPVAASPESVGVDNVAAYLPPDLLASVRAEKARHIDEKGNQATYDELLVEALAAISVEELRNHFAQPPTTRAGLLPTRVRAARGTGTIQLQLRLDGAQRTALNELIDLTRAPSRSALVAAAFVLYLEKGGRR